MTHLFVRKKTTYRPRAFGEVKLKLLLRRIQASETHRFEFTPFQVGKVSESFFSRQGRFTETKVISRLSPTDDSVAEDTIDALDDATPVCGWKIGGRFMRFLKLSA